MQIFATAAHRLGVASFCSAVFLAASAAASQAACLGNSCSQNGLIFSAASSSFDITDVTGHGTLADPFVVYQDVRGLDISLAISALANSSKHSIFNRPGFAISIVARNLTGAFWRFYDHELQETAGYASGENDGLSFAQGIGPVRPYTSSHYEQADEVTDVRDFINFYQGAGVNPGETVRFNYFVTDTIPNQRFYIRQRPDYRPNTPTTSAVLATLPVQVQPSVPSGNSATPEQTPAQPPQLPKLETAPAQSVPEPSTLSMGVLACLIGRLAKRHQRSRTL